MSLQLSNPFDANRGFCWTNIIENFENRFKIAFTADKKAHLDNVPDEFRIIDGAKGHWSNILLLDAILTLLKLDSFNASSRRAFNQGIVLYECILAEFRDIDPAGYDELLVKNKGVNTDLTEKYAHHISLHNLESPWSSVEELRTALLAVPHSKAKAKFEAIAEWLTNHTILFRFNHDFHAIVTELIHKSLFVFVPLKTSQISAFHKVQLPIAAVPVEKPMNGRQLLALQQQQQALLTALANGAVDGIQLAVIKTAKKKRSSKRRGGEEELTEEQRAAKTEKNNSKKRSPKGVNVASIAPKHLPALIAKIIPALPASARRAETGLFDDDFLMSDECFDKLMEFACEDDGMMSPESDGCEWVDESQNWCSDPVENRLEARYAQQGNYMLTTPHVPVMNALSDPSQFFNTNLARLNTSSEAQDLSDVSSNEDSEHRAAIGSSYVASYEDALAESVAEFGEECFPSFPSYVDTLFGPGSPSCSSNDENGETDSSGALSTDDSNEDRSTDDSSSDGEEQPVLVLSSLSSLKIKLPSTIVQKVLPGAAAVQSKLVPTTVQVRAGKASVVAMVPAVVDASGVTKVISSKVVPLIAVLPPILGPDGVTLISPVVSILPPVLTKDGKVVAPIVAVLPPKIVKQRAGNGDSDGTSSQSNSRSNSQSHSRNISLTGSDDCFLFDNLESFMDSD